MGCLKGGMRVGIKRTGINKIGIAEGFIESGMKWTVNA